VKVALVVVGRATSGHVGVVARKLAICAVQQLKSQKKLFETRK